MEELSIEEKARRYDDAINRMKHYVVDKYGCSRIKVADVFPELAESEDEMMVKFIKNQLFNIKKTITENYELDAKLTKAIDWLEKQGEQKPTEEYNITGIKSKHAQGKLGEMIKRKLEMEKQGEQILANSCKTCKDEQKPEVDQHSLPVSDDSSLPTFDEDVFHPCAEKVYGQKPTEWSEDDKKMARFIGNAITTNDASTYLKDKGIEVIDAHVWLESLKERVQPQTRQGWSEEDEENLKWFEKFFRAESVFAEGKNIPQDRYLWFKNLKGRVQSKQEWSEEDKKISTAIYESIDISILNDFGVSAHEAAIWLKSIRPQSHWKPSNEQMAAFEAMLTVSPQSSAITSALIELYEQMKKLREEAKSDV